MRVLLLLLLTAIAFAAHTQFVDPDDTKEVIQYYVG